jgi:predicted alpha/beta-fold hydrolase
LLYAGHHADRLPPQVRSCVGFSVPLDMGATADHLANNTLKVYMNRFLTAYRDKMRAKAKMMPGMFDLKKVEEVKNFREFDEAFNCPWLGFEKVDDFYHSISSMHALPKIRIPTLVVQAKNDPFLPPECFPVELCTKLEQVWLEMPDMGGHIGFYGRGGLWAEQRAVTWLRECLMDGSAAHRTV